MFSALLISAAMLGGPVDGSSVPAPPWATSEANPPAPPWALPVASAPAAPLFFPPPTREARPATKPLAPAPLPLLPPPPIKQVAAPAPTVDDKSPPWELPATPIPTTAAAAKDLSPPWESAGKETVAPAGLPPQEFAPPSQKVLLQPSPATDDQQPAVAENQPDSPARDTPDRWMIMRALQGTWYGNLLDRNHISVSGWAEMSYTWSNAKTGNVPFPSNYPMTWNDQANTFNLQQFWVRLDKALDKTGTEPSAGGRFDLLYGTDYRFTLMRGFLNDQLTNPGGGQQYYGVDLPQFYGNMYFPTVMDGLEIRVGRMFCPLGYESNEAVSTPLLSRSMTFNFSPFTHFGVMGILNVNPNWQLQAMAADGNDVWVGDPAQQWRFVGKIQYTSTDKRTQAAVSATLGQAEMNVGAPFAPTTLSTAFEPFGRNNLNAVDALVSRKLTKRLTGVVEGLLGWQYAPPGTPGFSDGSAIWASIVTYALLDITPKLSAVWRGEWFNDFDGQRTGFVGAYYNTTLGLQWRPRSDIIIRPEIRYDNNRDSTPFDNGTRKDLFTGAIDVILRF